MAAKATDPGSVLITGASSGIGRELAKIFAAEGYHPVLLARSRDKLQQLAQELKTSHGTKVTVMPADLSDPEAPRAVFERLFERGIDVDILVNDAGLMFEGDFATIALDEHLRLLHVNVVALTALTRLFLEPMLRRSRGRILNVASVGAFLPIPSLATYAASKAYVLSLSEALSEELKGTGVSVTALCPGFTNTAMVRGSPRGTRLPPLMVMDAKAVAKQGYSACIAGKALHVAGLSNDLAAWGIQYLPRSLVRTVGGLVARQWT
ncbi:MAG: SDR family NAD(P)-dependent oxidoreductase [Stellaceae bacterium]